jgi:hypothetical protein
VALDGVGQVVAPADSPRRSLYLQQRRTQPIAFLAAFDGPSGELNCDRRQSSTSAPQALMLMNSEFALTCGELFARRILSQPGTTDERITRAWRLAYQRNPSDEERALVAAFLERRRARLSKERKAEADTDTDRRAWSDVGQQLLSSNEVLYVD